MISAAFGHWLAGFTDGEGCFLIKKEPNRFSCRFAIGLRADDIDILYTIQKKLGIGNVHTFQNRKNGPVCKFDVNSRKDALVICDIFSKYPLRAKKARDFEIWKKAVHQWGSIQRTNQKNALINKDVWNQLGLLKNELQEIRTYKELAA